MGFMYTLIIVQSICIVFANRAIASQSRVEVFNPAAENKITGNFRQAENDPEGYYVSPVSRSKREVKLPFRLDQRAKRNSTITHVTNTTMMEILSNFSKQPQMTPKNFSAKRLEAMDRQNISPEAERVVVVRVTRSTYDALQPNDFSTKMGDLESLTKEEPDDLVTAAGYKSKKYILVKKKPKHKKIKMEVFEPKMKYKKIKMKVPVKKMKKKKVKGYLVKKEKYHR